MRDKICSYISKQIPGFQIKMKEGNFFMKLLSFVLFFNKKFATRYVTTIYPVIYFPKDMLGADNDLETAIILCHEFIHLRDRKKLSILFNILYLSPQIFALLALLAIPFSLNWLWCLLFLLPLPSPFRAYFEFRAYKMSIALYYLLLNKLPPMDFYVEQFTSSNYYWMMPAGKILFNKFNEHGRNLKNKQFDEITLEIKNVLFPTKL